ncbi:fatty-acyl-CoA synthase [Actinomadura hallensis]|uniref:Fatty-acyl-CoA synthase n=1 Tax=Actinomadura hallensis TaxID=337895 RepID=A0A543IEM0_9ACTN|nr:long-chain fatty acid--CoA ligase [Actinomadura hallensis]TQM69032.1 fatty-acyl-CoA synthase [Actinomadura hallensis]HLV74599.1 long-chain fatty acid--CoA ligase [Vulgatibacteraceae bacterium]
MRNEGLGSWPARRARKTPRAAALIHEGRTLTYADLLGRVARLAHALRGLGIRPGDRVAYLGPNHPSFLETLFATGMAGGVFVPLNARLTAPEITYQLADSGASALVYAPSHADLADDARGGTPVRAHIGVGDPGEGGYEALLAAAPDEPLDPPVALDDPCMIMYTSGTTGRPKGATLTHGNITWNAVNVLVDHDLVAREVALVSAPLFHTAALNMLALPVLLKGGTCVLTAAFDPAETLDMIARHRITFMFGVPTMFQRVAAEPGWADADLSSLRILTCGGAPVPPSLIETYQKRGLTFLQGYGMTEASPGTLFLDAGHAVSKAGSAGVPHFFSDVRVVGPGMEDVAPGETGEIVVRGPHVMSGYWGRPGDTAAAFSDGWFRSGDMARVDEDGYAYIVDRAKDVIISGGENVYPAEVENAILAHPGVLECAVIGVPDDTWGEVGRAVIVPRPGAEVDPGEVLGGLAGRLAGYKIPKSAVVAAGIPRNAAGKILRNRVREEHGVP